MKPRQQIHVQNIYDHRRTDARRYFPHIHELSGIANKNEIELWIDYLTWANSHIVGPPKANETTTQADLERTGMIGLYKLQEVAVAPVMPLHRIIITRLTGDVEWEIVTNPRWHFATRAFSSILINHANKYAEYENSGVVHRMIRVKDARHYGILTADIKPEWALDPLEANDG